MSPGQLRTQNVLVVAQVAVALVLLVASGLLIRSFVALRGVHPGFTRPERVQTIRIVIPDTQVPEPERAARMQADIIGNVSRLPGVEVAAFADGLPMDPNHRSGNPVAVEGRYVPDQIPPNRRIKYVSPGLFAAQGTRFLAGRDFTWRICHGAGWWRSCRKAWPAKTGADPMRHSAKGFGREPGA
jgi:hypothetical protein